MDDEVETVNQYPVGRDIPLDMIWSMPDRLESCLDPVGDRLHLSGASTRADDEVVRERVGRAQIEHDEVARLLLMRRIDCLADWSGERRRGTRNRLVVSHAS